MNCTTCGSVLVEGARFCGQCGQTTAAATRCGATAVGVPRRDMTTGRQKDLGQTRVMGSGTGNMSKHRKCFPVDIVFVIDCTGSMGPYIVGVKDTVIAFSRDLEANNIDSRIGLVEYRDLKIGEPINVHGIADTPEVFRSWVALLSPTGGGDEPESAIDATYKALGMAYRPGATRIVVLVTDASAHDPAENGRTMLSLCDDVRASKTLCYVIGPDLAGYRQLADSMGGLLFPISGDPSGFRSIIKSLCGSISETVPRMRDVGAAADAALRATRVR